MGRYWNIVLGFECVFSVVDGLVYFFCGGIGYFCDYFLCCRIVYFNLFIVGIVLKFIIDKLFYFCYVVVLVVLCYD